MCSKLPKTERNTLFSGDIDEESGSIGAGDRFRTDDLVLGKHALYQLSYTRSPIRENESISLSGTVAPVKSSYQITARLTVGANGLGRNSFSTRT